MTSARASEIAWSKKGNRYTVHFDFPDGKVRIALWDDNGDLKILAMHSIPQKKGLGRRALNILKEEGIVGRPVTVRRKAEKFWDKMISEGLAAKET